MPGRLARTDVAGEKSTLYIASDYSSMYVNYTRKPIRRVSADHNYTDQK